MTHAEAAAWDARRIQGQCDPCPYGENVLRLSIGSAFLDNTWIGEILSAVTSQLLDLRVH